MGACWCYSLLREIGASTRFLVWCRNKNGDNSLIFPTAFLFTAAQIVIDRPCMHTKLEPRPGSYLHILITLQAQPVSSNNSMNIKLCSRIRRRKKEKTFPHANLDCSTEHEMDAVRLGTKQMKRKLDRTTFQFALVSCII